MDRWAAEGQLHTGAEWFYCPDVAPFPEGSEQHAFYWLNLSHVPSLK